MARPARLIIGQRLLRRGLQLSPLALRAIPRTVGGNYHSHASALHYLTGFTIPEAARRLGHGAGLHVETYAHVIDAISGQRFADLDALFAAAREDPMFAICSPAATGSE